MKIGYIEIENAYLGLKLLNSSNAFIGTVPLIDSSSGPTPPTPSIDYFYVELDQTMDSSNNWILNIKNKLEYSLDKTNWSTSYQSETGVYSVTDLILNLISTYGRNRVLPIRGTKAFPTGLTLATNNEGRTSTVVTNGQYKYMCFIMDNDLTTYTNGISFTTDDSETTWTISASYITTYLNDSAKTGIAVNATSATGTITAVAVKTLVITTQACIIKNYLSLLKNDRIYFRSSTGEGNPISSSQSNYYKIGGDIQSIFDYTNMNNTTTNSMESMFQQHTKLTDASNLKINASTASNYCCRYMFRECTNLRKAPSILQITTLANNCYNAMFSGCTSLTSAPELPATTLANYCYNSMFSGCTSLTSAPELSATTLATGCYSNMFYGCTSLTSAPELSATTLYAFSYNAMFSGCTSLSTAPALPATTLASNCYREMFAGCTNLNYIKCLATDISASNSTTNWTYGVAASGTFVKDSTMSSWTTGANGIPSGWTVENA